MKKEEAIGLLAKAMMEQNNVARGNAGLPALSWDNSKTKKTSWSPTINLRNSIAGHAEAAYEAIKEYLD